MQLSLPDQEQYHIAMLGTKVEHYFFTFTALTKIPHFTSRRKVIINCMADTMKTIWIICILMALTLSYEGLVGATSSDQETEEELEIRVLSAAEKGRQLLNELASMKYLTLRVDNYGRLHTHRLTNARTKQRPRQHQQHYLRRLRERQRQRALGQIFSITK